MKLLFFGPSHHKITQSIQHMCQSIGWRCEFTTSDARLQTGDYEIVIMNTKYLPPEYFPPAVKIIYGPQLWVIPTGAIVATLNTSYQGRACYNSLSRWVGEYIIEMADSLIVPIIQFPFSIDVEKFSPSIDTPKTLDCILYCKHRRQELIRSVHTFLQGKDIRPVIYKYGSYKEEDYIRDLKRVKFMIVVDANESQGYALQEAMSCNVPLFVMDATSLYDEVNDHGVQSFRSLHPKLLKATSVPYWSDKCGVRFTELSELPSAFEDFTKKLETGEFHPREYVLETLSPEVCMRRILDYFHLPTA